MSGYAQNPQSPSDPSYASLTAGLLARKGEAMPAVDADAHAGVDIEMHQAVTANVANKGFTKQTVENLYPANSEGSQIQQSAMAAQTSNAFESSTHNKHHTSPIGSTNDWAVSSSMRRLLKHREKPPQPAAANGPQRKATVRFRMSVQDFVRLRFASRDMEMSCQAIILEALDCYLDANDVMPVTEEECKAELKQLARKNTQKRASNKTPTLVE